MNTSKLWERVARKTASRKSSITFQDSNDCYCLYCNGRRKATAHSQSLQTSVPWMLGRPGRKHYCKYALGEAWKYQPDCPNHPEGVFLHSHTPCISGETIKQEVPYVLINMLIRSLIGSCRSSLWGWLTRRGDAPAKDQEGLKKLSDHWCTKSKGNHRISLGGIKMQLQQSNHKAAGHQRPVTLLLINHTYAIVAKQLQ
jgi:hypothetical protein